MSKTIQIHPASNTDARGARQVPWNKRTTDTLVDDVRWLLVSGESTWQIAARLGFQHRTSLARALMRGGRYDLAARFNRDDEANSGRWIR